MSRRTGGIARIVIGALVGTALGVGAYTFVYARGASYLTDEPQACGNCHVMSEQVAGWVKGSHRAAAVCNDCHTPPGLVAKYAVKARNGFRHSFAFTTGRFPEPIRITPANRAATERACRKCHADVVQAIDAHGLEQGRPLVCIRCHDSVGHLE